MTISRMTFGEHLRQFALSIDFIDGTYYELVQQHIKEYLRLQLGAVQVGFFVRTTVDDQPGMMTVWSYPTLRVYQSLRDAQGQYRRQLALAIGDKRSLWVVSEHEHLSPANPGANFWQEGSPCTGLPPFQGSVSGGPAKTAVFLVTRDASGDFNGVLVVEIANAVRPTRALRAEMNLIAEAVGLLHATDIGTRESREGTNRAIGRLGDLVRQLELDTGPRPLLFVASAKKARRDVMAALSEVLREFDSYVFVQHWGDMHSPGNINLQLVEKIRRAQYGICYLSEPAADEETGDEATPKSSDNPSDTAPRYRDNPNVLVEAGMLHMVTGNPAGAITGWIPLREHNSPDIPFDLESQRLLIIRRDEHDGLNVDEFKEELRIKLRSLLAIVDGKQEQAAA